MLFHELNELNQDIVEQIVAIEQESFGAGGMNPWFLVPFIRHGRVYVILEDKLVIAVAEFMSDFTDNKHAYLFGFAVHSQYRRQGYGTILLEKSCQSLAKEGWKQVSLTAHPRNIAACTFYERAGFVHTCLRYNEYGQGEDRLVYELDLAKYKE